MPRIERVLAPPSGPAGMSLGERTGLFAFALLAIFFSQELAEGFAAGDGAPLAGLAGQGVWLALPLAVGLGLIAAVCSRLLDHAEATVAVRVRPRVPRRAPAVLLCTPRSDPRGRLLLAARLRSLAPSAAGLALRLSN